MKAALYVIAFFAGILLVCISCDYNSNEENDVYGWEIFETNSVVPATRHEIYSEVYGLGNTNYQHQSMFFYADKVFCFESGAKCKVYDFHTFNALAYCDLQEDSHHNNAQITDIFYSNKDKYPLLLLSRGDYPPNKNACYIVRIQETSNNFSFKVIKTIHNSIKEAQNNGSWIIDERNGFLYLYCMDNGDYRTTEDNHFCIFQFRLPDILNDDSDYYLTYSDVLNKWTSPYLVLQGGTCHEGNLIFNVEGLSEIEGRKTERGRYAIVFNPQKGRFLAKLPLMEINETEGICIYNNKLYISYKDGLLDRQPDYVMFKIMEYSLPENLF